MSRFLNIRFLNKNAIQQASITMVVDGNSLVINPATNRKIAFTGSQNVSKTIPLGELPHGLDVHHAISLRFYVSLGSPALDASAFNTWGAPSLTNTSDPNWNVRWDIFEVTVTPKAGDYGDLSTINGYAIPMMIDTFESQKPGAPGTGMSTARSYRVGNPYAALQTLMNANSANNNYGGYPPLVPANGIVTNGGQFVRLIGPNNGGFSPTLAMGGPFPSFNGYLEKLKGITTKLTDDGEVPGHTWNLTAGSTGSKMTLEGVIDGTDFAMQIDKDTNVGTSTAMYTWSSMVYMAPGPGTGNPGLHFQLGKGKDKKSVTEAEIVTKFTTATVSQIYHDLFTAYSFGLVGNQQKVTGWSNQKYSALSLNDMGSAGWRRLALDAVPSDQIPLFSKNMLGAGCHHEWAAKIYASSSSVYGFAYSDALQHSIAQQSYQLGDKPVRSWLVTILPDP